MRHHRNPIVMPQPSTAEVAPHRYTWDGKNDVEGDRSAMTWSEFLHASPYKEGEVIYTVYGDGFAKAYVSLVAVDHDRFDDRQHKYRIHRENKRGDSFSKTFYYVWPGQVQKGYMRAGLAPDCEGKL